MAPEVDKRTQEIKRIGDAVWSYLLREKQAPTIHDLAREIGMPHEWIEPRWRSLTRSDLPGGRMFEIINPWPRVAGSERMRPTYEALVARLASEQLVEVKS